MHTKLLRDNHGVHNLCVEYVHLSRVPHISKQLACIQTSNSNPFPFFSSSQETRHSSSLLNEKKKYCRIEVTKTTLVF